MTSRYNQRRDVCKMSGLRTQSETPKQDAYPDHRLEVMLLKAQVRDLYDRIAELERSGR